MRLLVCEDNPIIAMELEFLLEGAGHRVVAIAARSTAAIAAARDHRPDAALVDLGLADGRTGMQVADELRRLGIPFVIVSGELGFLPEDHGAAALLEKPVSRAALLEALEERIGGGN